MADDHLDGGSGPADGPASAKPASAREADRAPGARPKAGAAEPAAPPQPQDAGTTEEEALRALSGAAAIRDERVRAASIVDELFRRLGDDPGPRIGSVNVFDGKVEVAEGDFTIGAGKAARPAELRAAEAVALLETAFVERRAATYVRPAGFERALDILAGRHLLVLCGPQGSGREATALALLMETAAHSQLHLVSSTALLAEHGWSCGEPGTGFAVAPLDLAAAGQLDDVWLEQTAKRLSDAGNFMVVVAGVPSGAFATADRRADFAFEHLGAPDAMAILAKRAKIAIHPSRMPALLTLLSRSDVRETLDADASPAFAARMARAITDALNEHKDIEQTVRALRSPAAQVQAWFDRYDGEAEADYRQLVLPIAVSVLEDSSYLTVTDAAVALYRQLFPEEEGPPPLRFRRSLREQQQWIQLTSSGSTYAPECEVLRFRSPQLRSAVLRHTWTWLDGIRPALSTWLDELAAHPAVDVRARTAASAGLLAMLDFPYVLHHFLYSWAVSRSAAARDCAALALTIPGRNAQYETQVWALLRQWAADGPERSGSQLAGTAAEAAGSVLGRHRALDALGVCAARGTEAERVGEPHRRGPGRPQPGGERLHGGGPRGPGGLERAQ